MEYTASLLPAMPEIFLLGAACVILVIDLFLGRETRVYTLGLSLAALVATIVVIYATAAPERVVVFHGAYVRDAMGDALKVAMLAVTFFAFIYARHYLVQRGAFRGEYFLLALLGLLGMMIMVSAGGFLSIYLGLELLALTLYALVAFDRGNPQGTEAAMKYFVLGAIASGLLLYGISMIYGATGYFSFAGIAEAVASGQADQKVLLFGLVFVVIGVAFKFGAVPFHMWAPDVYEGAPMPVVAFLGSVPKIAALAMAIRILHDGLGGLGGWQGWDGMLMILAVLSLLLGNLVALVQTGIKRLLAYSTIAHVGFILLGILAGEGAGYTAAMFYTVTYALTAVGAFGLLTVLSGKGMEARELHDLKGLNQRNPWLAGLMLMFMFSMAGVPGFVGFFAKLYVIQALLDAGQLGLAVFAVVMSVVGAYYYLKVLKHVYFDKPITQAPIQGGVDAQLAVSVNGLALVYYGWLPGALLAFCQAAMGLKV